MELVEGPTLADRITRGPIPLDEALPIAKQIAEALEAAHEQGIIHRDLKPANIKVRPDGTVKVLDFGLAKAMDPVGGSSENAINSPTISMHATQAGIILGTAAYMAPEQTRGSAVDKRADLWAFGVVLYEMLTGTRPFGGATISDTLASVLKSEPDWTVLPAHTPAPIRTLLRRCLEKECRRRLDSAAAARLEIDDALSAPSSVTNHSSSGDQQPAWRRFALPVVAALVIGGIVVATSFSALTKGSRALSPAGVVRFAIHDTDRVIVSRAEGDIALSPDGRTLAFVGYGEGGPRIWIRALDALDARPLPGTEDAASPVWSPDGRWLAFTAFGRVMKAAVAGGTPQMVTAARDSSPSPRFSPSTGVNNGKALAWGPDGSILYADGRGVWWVQASGGVPTNLIPIDADAPPTSPEFLPDGHHFLISVRSTDPAKAGTFVEAIEGGARTRIFAFATMARYAGQRLLFVRDHVLYAQAFDLSRLQLGGDPVPLAERVTVFSGSDNGAVAYVALSSSEQTDSGQLEWFDRSGKELGRIDKAAGAIRPALSPDGRRLAMGLGGDIWTLDLERSVLSRLTVGLGPGAGSTWLPDGQRLMFNRGGSKNRPDVIYEQAIGSAAKETIVQEPDAAGDHAHPTDISADGQYLIYEGGDGYDIWVKRLTGDRKARAYVQAPSMETQGTLSPDGRSLAYTSDSSGRGFEIYVQSFPEPGPRNQVSANGGSSARWRRDGKELFYLAPDGTLMALPIRSADPVEFGPPAALFRFFTQRRGIPAGHPPYDVTPDGQRFIVSAVVRRTDPSINVLLNWPALIASSKP